MSFSFYRLPKRLSAISQGSVAMQQWCGGIRNNHVIAHFPQRVAVKVLLKYVHVWQRYGQKSGGTFLWATVYVVVEIPNDRVCGHDELRLAGKWVLEQFAVGLNEDVSLL